MIVLHIYRRTAKFLSFLHTFEPISHYCLSGQHNYTRGPLADINALISEIPISNTTLKINHSESHCSIVCLHFILRQFFVPDTSNPYEIMIAKWPGECSEHKKDPALVFMHKRAVTVNFSSNQPVWCWLTFLPNQRNPFSCSLFIFCTSAQ
jgi:hypothetical protein